MLSCFYDYEVQQSIILGINTGCSMAQLVLAILFNFCMFGLIFVQILLIWCHQYHCLCFNFQVLDVSTINIDGV